jgi:hypothetical protein
MLYSDAGGNMVGGCMIVNKRVCEDTVFKINLSEEEVFMSSTYRELRGIEEGMKALAGRIEGKGIRWHCDNWSACKIVEFGSMKEDCHTVAKRINDLIHQLDVSFEIVWLSRESEEDWSRGFGYFHPPVGLVPKVLDKAREDEAQGILVVPDWPGSVMAREIECCEQLELVARWKPLFECPAWFENSTFRGVPKFDVLAFRMRF